MYLKLVPSIVGPEIQSWKILSNKDKLIDRLCIHTPLARTFIEAQSWNQLVEIRDQLLKDRPDLKMYI